jgi:hypothetical protein
MGSGSAGGAHQRELGALDGFIKVLVRQHNDILFVDIILRGDHRERRRQQQQAAQKGAQQQVARHSCCVCSAGPNRLSGGVNK